MSAEKGFRERGNKIKDWRFVLVQSSNTVKGEGYNDRAHARVHILLYAFQHFQRALKHPTFPFVPIKIGFVRKTGEIDKETIGIVIFREPKPCGYKRKVYLCDKN